MNNVVKEFLSNWKENAWEYYKEELELSNEMSYEEYCERHPSRSKRDMIHSSANEEYFDKILDKEVAQKEKSFINRVEKKAGKILDAELSIGRDGNINGTVVGELKTVTVRTILAGGYNIQSIHYRVLVK